ncbi:2-hydroxy-3-oxopropionate reductase [Proteiniclasticum sp. C24MP]|uniref:2-hydroxy-3-oxopropionate reductase n=1 Tax=Proteiniclasticum sp. C24MP TaxID=3374101 RepID=UPI0037543C37
MKVGFIGLGIMGKPMALNLMKAGHELKVYNRSKEVVEELVSLGAQAAASHGDAAVGVDALITMLPDSPDVKKVMIGENGVYDSAGEGLLYIDMSSILPEVSVEVGEKLREKGIHMLDAPVSGGDQGAIAGTLAIMAGGEEEDFRRAVPLFEAMGKSYVLVGPLGSGNTCKLTNNMIVAGNIAILSEALLLCRKSGTDLTKVLDAIRGGSAGSAVLESKSPRILHEDYNPGFKIDLHIKDLRNALITGTKLHIPMPLTEEILGMYRELSEDGMGNDDHSALFRYFENHSS